MITAIDSSVVIDVLTAHPSHGPASSDALRHATRIGTVLACPVVWAELSAWYSSADRVHADMAQLGVAFSPIPEEAAVEAGIAWRRYRLAGGPRTRVVADFLIGAHASTVADVLLTRDRGFHRRYFRALKVIDPSVSRS